MSEYKEIYDIKREIYKHNEQYGRAYIIGLFVEEMAECTAELMRVLNRKDVRSEKILEEIADVEIMLEQAKESLNLYGEFNRVRESKIIKTAEKLGIETRKEVVQDEEIN